MKSTILFAVLGALTLTGTENMIQNPGFEEYKGNFCHWGYNRKIDRYHFLDTKVVHSGKNSLRFENVDKYDSFVQTSRPVAEFKNDVILRGWVKYENLRNDAVEGKSFGLPFIGIWTNNKNGTNNLSFPALRFNSGSRDWFPFEHRFKAEDFQKQIAALRHDRRPATWSFRINVSNQPGKIWFDDLEMIEVPPVALKAALSGSSFTSDHKIVTLETVSQNALKAEIRNAAGKTIGSRAVGAGTQKCDFALDKLPVGGYSVVVSPEKGGEPVILKFTKEASAFED